MVSPPEEPPFHGGDQHGNDTDAMLGRLIAGKFEIVELLGSGAMGAVYRAEQVALDKHVALKILHPSLRQDATFVRRFHREAKAAAALEHPNSVSILDFGEEPDGLLYIAMEYLDGRDLFQLIQEEWPLSKERIVALMRQVCGAVARAHDTGVVHRDLKPENIMVISRVGDDGEFEEVVKVCDFGIAHLQKSPEVTAAGTGLLVGTPEYMAPEVARGEEPDGRSDLYALGVVLYQILTKRLPFEGGDPLRVAMLHVQQEPLPPHQLVSDVDSFLEDVALIAMAKSPDRRFATARQMRGALRAALENREYSAADLSGVLSVLPPNVAARLVASHGSMSERPAAVSPRIPAAAPIPDIAALSAVPVRIGVSTPAAATPMALSVSELEGHAADRLDTGGRHNAEINAEPEPPRRSKLPWLAAASAAAVVGVAGFLLVGRMQTSPESARSEPEAVKMSAAAPASLAATPPMTPPAAAAVPAEPVVVGAVPAANPAVVAASEPTPASPPARVAPASKASKPGKSAKPSAPSKQSTPKPKLEPDLEPDEHGPADLPTHDAVAPTAPKDATPSGKKDAAAPAPKDSATNAPKPAAPTGSAMPPTWGGGTKQSSPEAPK